MPNNASNIPMTQLLERLANKTATIGIIGMGYVGLPLMLRFSEVGDRKSVV
jgi:UDP-N-acetyl-D-glucosamine dehydrogenase